MRSLRISAAFLFVLLTCVAAGTLGPEKASGQPATTGTPDLIVNSDLLSRQWVVRDEQLDATACSVQEGGITPGDHTIIRFTVETPNIGNADINVGDPNAHIAAGDGLFEFATCHNHYHFRHYALYQLIDPKTGFVWKAAKKGFCMLDTDPVPNSTGGEPPRDGRTRTGFFWEDNTSFSMAETVSQWYRREPTSFASP